jgi:hypothetical protein
MAWICELRRRIARAKEMLIYSFLSFPRRRESSQVKELDPRLRGDDELIGASLMFCGMVPMTLQG